jgi:hypothetical protein
MKSRQRKDDNDRLVENLLASVRNREPILIDPERLTENIMNAIRDKSQENDTGKRTISGELPAFIILRRLLAAASVCLFLVFGYEEYVVMEKISRLEKQSSAISKSSQYQAALNLKKAMTLISINPQMINQYFELNTSKINIRTLFKAAMIADMSGFSPEDLKSQYLAGWNKPSQPIISFLNNFDSSHYSRQR